MRERSFILLVSTFTVIIIHVTVPPRPAKSIIINSACSSVILFYLYCRYFCSVHSVISVINLSRSVLLDLTKQSIQRNITEKSSMLYHKVDYSLSLVGLSPASAAVTIETVTPPVIFVVNTVVLCCIKWKLDYNCFAEF